MFTTAWHTAQCYNSLIQNSVHNSLTQVPVLFFSIAQQPLMGQNLLIIEASRSHLDTPHSVGFLWTSDQRYVDTKTSTKQLATLARDRYLCHRRHSNPGIRFRGIKINDEWICAQYHCQVSAKSVQGASAGFRRRKTRKNRRALLPIDTHPLRAAFSDPQICFMC